LGTTTITWTFADAANNVKTCTQTVTVADDDAPVLDCATLTAIHYTTQAPNCNNDTDVSVPVAEDNCNGNISGVGTRSDNASLNAPWPLGTTTITWTFTDAANNVKTCTQNVVVTDNDAPVLHCATLSTINYNTYAPNCNNDTDVSVPVAVDNCDGNISGVGIRSDNASMNAQWPLGTTTITWTFTDAANNVKTCMQTVTVADDDAPVLDCATLSTINYNTDAPNCNNDIDVSVPVAVDNCDGNISGVGTRSDNGSLNAPWPLGTTTITWTFTDAANNVKTCTQTVTVADDDAPVLDCATLSTINYNTDAPNCNNDTDVSVPVAVDNCDGNLSGVGMRSDNASMNALWPLGTTTITWTFADAANNVKTCTQTVTVADDDAPVINRVGASTIDICKNNSYTDPGATAEDNCDGNLTGMIVTDNPVNTAIPGTYIITYDVADAAGNNATQVSRTVVIHELPAPVCPADFNACRTGGNINLIGATPAGGNYSGTGVSGNVFNPLVAGLGIHTIQYDYTDGYGCMGSCTFDITVFEAPILNVNDGMYYCTIADALAATMTQDGDVIEIPAGMYNDPCILINKSVVFRPVGGMVSIQCLEMNGDDKIMVLDGNLTIVQLTLSDGLIRTNGNNLKCGTISGGSANSYLVTD
jgi:hypothetical protein